MSAKRKDIYTHTDDQIPFLKKLFSLNVGTKSVLFGAHCFFIHPFFVLAAWWKLYGFPWDPRLWIAFFVHDLGYWGKPNMDGPEGETHVELGAKLLSIFDYRIILKSTRAIYKNYPYYTNLGYKAILEYKGYVLAKRNTKKWADFSRYHSRFYAKKDGVSYSKLCVADKLAICIEPAWLYLPRVKWSGEIVEYMEMAGRGKYAGEPLSKYEHMKLTTKSQKDWHAAMTNYMRRWIDEHKECKVDTWTPGRNKRAIFINF